MGVSGTRLCNNECLHRIPLYGSYEYLTSCHYTKVFAGKFTVTELLFLLGTFLS